MLTMYFRATSARHRATANGIRHHTMDVFQALNLDGQNRENLCGSRFRADALRFENNVRFGEPDEAMQISTRDAQAAGRKGLVAVVIAYSIDGEFHFIIAEQVFECAFGIVFADVDDL